jgi:hypothetical protein
VLQSPGYTIVINMVGGFNERSKQGFRIEKGTKERK